MILVAIISGAVSLAAAAIALWSGRSVARLSSELEERRRLASKREQAEELRARYRDPLLTSAFDLQSRLYNIVAQDFLVRYARGDESSREYAIDNTLYLLAEYLAWVEIIRSEIRFLDLGDEFSDRRWLNALEAVRDTLARDDVDAVLRVFRGEQRAIGEMASVTVDDPGGGRRQASLGYARFVARRRAADFNRWFHKLQADIELLAVEPYTHLERVVLLQDGLIDVLDIIDPDCSRFPAQRRTRLAQAAAQSQTPAPSEVWPTPTASTSLRNRS